MLYFSHPTGAILKLSVQIILVMCTHECEFVFFVFILLPVFLCNDLIELNKEVVCNTPTSPS